MTVPTVLEGGRTSIHKERQGTIALIDGIYFEVGGGGRSSNIPENASWSQLPESTKNLGS